MSGQGETLTFPLSWTRPDTTSGHVRATCSHVPLDPPTNLPSGGGEGSKICKNRPMFALCPELVLEHGKTRLPIVIGKSIIPPQFLILLWGFLILLWVPLILLCCFPIRKLCRRAKKSGKIKQKKWQNQGPTCNYANLCPKFAKLHVTSGRLRKSPYETLGTRGKAVSDVASGQGETGLSP